MKPRSPRIVRSTVATLAPFALLLSAAATVGAPAADAATMCSSDCIGNISATPTPNGVAVAFNTTVPAKTTLSVYKGGGLVATTAEQTAVSVHSLKIADGLNQNTDYTLKLAATDSANTTRFEYANTRTYVREAKFFLDRIRVVNDSDSAGSGEITGWVKLGTTQSQLWGGAEKSMTDGQEYDWPVGGEPTTATVNTPNAYPAAVMLIDDDTYPLGPYCPPVVNWNTGTNDCIDWATASGSVSTLTALGDSSSTTKFSSPDNAALRLDAWVRQTSHIYTVPGVPRSVAVTPGAKPTDVLVSWQAPLTNGNSPLTKYTATASPSGVSCAATPPATSCNLNSLPAAGTQTITVRAFNAAGSTAASGLSYTPLTGVIIILPLPQPTDPAPTVPANPGGGTTAPSGSTPTPTPSPSTGGSGSGGIGAGTDDGSANSSANRKAVVNAKAVRRSGRLSVDVDPNMGSKFWTFRVQKKTTKGWKTLRKTHRTTGAKELRTIDLPKGTYRAVVAAKFGLATGVSKAVALKR